MTFEELKLEARKHGYNLIKIQERVKLLDCTCGCNRRTHWTKIKDNVSFEGLECMRCGRKVWGKTNIEARINWNKEIQAELDADK